jgi:hypothetical protein
MTQYSAATAPKCLRIEDVSTTVSYFGYAVPGTPESSPTWRIVRLTLTGSVAALEYANGDTSQNAAWADRASYTYS